MYDNEFYLRQLTLSQLERYKDCSSFSIEPECINYAIKMIKEPREPNYRIVLCSNGKIHQFEYINIEDKDIPEDMCCENCKFNNKGE